MVAYRENNSGRCGEIRYLHATRSSRCTWPFARIKLQWRATPSRSGFQIFENTGVGGSWPKEYIPGVEGEGALTCQGKRLLAVILWTDFKATLIDGAYHDVTPRPSSFRIAARGAFPGGCKGRGSAA